MRSTWKGHHALDQISLNPLLGGVGAEWAVGIFSDVPTAAVWRERRAEARHDRLR